MYICDKKMAPETGPFKSKAAVQFAIRGLLSPFFCSVSRFHIHSVPTTPPKSSQALFWDWWWLVELNLILQPLFVFTKPADIIEQLPFAYGNRAAGLLGGIGAAVDGFGGGDGEGGRGGRRGDQDAHTGEIT